MIKVNDKQYNTYNIEITWENFEICSFNKKRKGLAPFITVNIENNIFIGLEFTISTEILRSYELDTKTNIKKYLSDVLYKNERGWVSIINGKYDCNIVRTSENDFKIEFRVKCGEISIIFDSDFENSNLYL